MVIDGKNAPREELSWATEQILRNECIQPCHAGEMKWLACMTDSSIAKPQSNAGFLENV